MKIFSIIEAYLFKERLIITYQDSQDSQDSAESSSSVICHRMDEVGSNNLSCGTDARLANHFRNRHSSSSWVFFEYIENGVRLGYSFLHTPNKIEWNDSLPTRAGEARIGSNFVYPEFRGKGIRKEILKRQLAYARKENLFVWSVVEKNNISSLKAELKFGQVSRRNFLIKVVGMNFISLLSRPLVVYFLTGNKRARR